MLAEVIIWPLSAILSAVSHSIWPVMAILSVVSSTRPAANGPSLSFLDAMKERGLRSL
jgi:hypothetical protein